MNHPGIDPEPDDDQDHDTPIVIREGEGDTGGGPVGQKTDVIPASAMRRSVLEVIETASE